MSSRDITYLLFLFLLGIWKSGGSTCPNATLAEQQIHYNQFLMNGYSQAEITKIVRDETSGNIYYYGKVFNSGKAKTSGFYSQFYISNFS